MKKSEKLDLAQRYLESTVFAKLPAERWDTFNRGYSSALSVVMREMADIPQALVWQLASIAQAFVANRCPGMKSPQMACLAGCDCKRNGLPTLKDLDSDRLLYIERRMKVNDVLLADMLDHIAAADEDDVDLDNPPAWFCNQDPNRCVCGAELVDTDDDILCPNCDGAQGPTVQEAVAYLIEED